MGEHSKNKPNLWPFKADFQAISNPLKNCWMAKNRRKFQQVTEIGVINSIDGFIFI